MPYTEHLLNPQGKHTREVVALPPSSSWQQSSIMGGGLVSRSSSRAVCLLRALFHSCFCSRSPGAKAQSTAGPKECALAEGTPLPCPGMYFLKNVFDLCWSFVADGFTLAEASRGSLAVLCRRLTAACGIFPDQQLNLSLALEGEFFSTETPGTPLACILINRLALSAEAAECHMTPK